jgi:YD repeat-containing protein
MTPVPVPTDSRLLDQPLQRVACGHCTATVQVRKASWEQTTLQWDQQSQRACIERQSASAAGREVAMFRGCHALSESIRRAADCGRLGLVDDQQER